MPVLAPLIVVVVVLGRGFQWAAFDRVP